jgi:hypothetical protein
MFSLKVLKRFQKTFGSWRTVTPSRPKLRPTVKPRLEELEERWCPAGGQPDHDTIDMGTARWPGRRSGSELVR